MEYSFFDLLKLLGSLALFLYGMKIMSEGLQKFAGNKLRSILAAMTTNRVAGMLTGILITALIQSSSATTVMVVSFVNAGLLTLKQSISVIMGANIGTTVTAWIISVFGFKVDIAGFAIPLLAFGIPLMFSQKNSRKSIGEFIFGFSFLFMGLSFLQSNAPDLSKNPEMLAFVQGWTDMGFGSVIIFVLVGTVITMIVQASAATMAVTLIMCANGWINFELGAALAMGQNIGTTITANLAALTANAQARRAAMAHLLFNVFGVVVFLIFFNPAIAGVKWLVANTMGTMDAGTQVAFELSTFHTLFNVINTFLLIWFVDLMEKAVSLIIPKKETDEEFHLKFISGGILSTSELSILQAKKEIFAFVDRTKKMFVQVQKLYDEKNESEAVKIYSKIEKYESICDRLEVEIANYLNKVAEGRLSDHGKQEIHKLLREISEIESIGDSCFNMSRTLLRKAEKKVVFTDEVDKNIRTMMDLVKQSIEQLDVVLHSNDNFVPEVDKSNNIENEINNFRAALKKHNIVSLNEKAYTYEVGVMYMDFIMECEKMGDYIINVVEAHCEVPKAN